LRVIFDVDCLSVLRITTYTFWCLQAIYLMTEQDMEKVGDAPFRRTQDIFTKMDINNDGVLSKDEFIKGCMNDETLYRLLACSSAGGDANTNAAS